MINTSSVPTISVRDFLLLFLPAILTLVLHFYVNFIGGYGYFRDELYYIACSERLDFGFVDQPPLSIFILAINRFLFGDSIFALRLVPALVSAGTVILVGLMARAMGAGFYGCVIASFAAALAPISMAMGGYYSMNSLDIMIWSAAAIVLLRLSTSERPSLWILLGILLGLGLLNKISVVWLGCGIVVGLMLTPHRRLLTTRWPWIGAAIALLLFLPYVIWNVLHDLPHLEFVRNATAGKYSSLTPLRLIGDAVLQQNPVSTPLWMAGIWFFFLSKEGKAFRFLGYIFVVTFFILFLNIQSKAEYLAPASGILLAGGGVQIEKLFGRLRVMKPIYLLLVVLSGLALLPLTIPILPVETYITYAATIGIGPSTSEAKELDLLPQYYADMFGWEEKAAAVAKVYHALTPEEQAKCAIFADNYGRSAAIDFFREKYGLPKAIGRHNNYWIWGPGEYTGEIVIVIGGGLRDKQESFEQVEIAGTAPCDYCMPYEKNLNIYLCRNLRTPLGELWPRLKHYE